MAKILAELLEKAVCDGHINYLEYDKFTDPIKIGIDSNGYYNLVLQHADNGTLREYLKSNFTSLQWVDKLRIAKEIAIGLSFLHDNNIIHRDLHSKNILVHQGKSKIAGFGLSKQINKTLISVAHEMLAFVEPKCFTVPKYTLDKKSDIYSFGVILWEVSSGSPPFCSK
ncbi:kinase-like protein [Gigaspora margarita]|uniref:Kinase-like protein n=1 Tax=Gigaspora margarita TaxID=4874 RepID=A0A8H3XH93_GIGMA|nr:kinase-like protein [Gigaspora margarita]